MIHPQIMTFSSADQMQAWAAQFLTTLSGGEVLFLEGDLGAGKTTFTQGLAGALGVKEEVASPTFTIASEYEISGHPIFHTLVHVDLYRFSEGEPSRDGMVQEILRGNSQNDTLTVIEWADRLGGEMVPNSWLLRFRHGEKDSERIVEIIPSEGA